MSQLYPLHPDLHVLRTKVLHNLKSNDRCTLQVVAIATDSNKLTVLTIAGDSGGQPSVYRQVQILDINGLTDI